MWAKAADAVILTSFAGRTISRLLKEAKDRLMEINATILGTVLTNVQFDRSYYHYAYKAYAEKARANRKTSRQILLLPSEIDNKS